MKNKKKQVRDKFRNEVFKRDHFRCRKCGKVDCELDAHHITNRNELPNGGYVVENGISLCAACHILAEKQHSEGKAEPGYSVEDLYELIASSKERAWAKAQKLR